MMDANMTMTYEPFGLTSNGSVGAVTYISNSTSTHAGNITSGPEHAETVSAGMMCFMNVTVTYIFPAILIIGTVGNLLSFIVLVRKRLRGNSLYFYLTVLTVADTLVLYVSCLKTWVRHLTGSELLHVSDASCKLIKFTLLMSMHMAAWLIVLVTFDRFVSVWFPFRAASICTTRRARLITLVLFISVVALDMHVFWTMGLYPAPYNPEHLICSPRPNDPFIQLPFEYLKLTTYCFIPFGLVLALNAGIMFKITRGSSTLRRSDSVVTNGSVSFKSGTFLSRVHSPLKVSGSPRMPRQQRVVYMLLTLSFSWLILTAPYGVVSVIITALPDVMSLNTYVFLKTFAFLMLYLNHAINFYLYCITGKKFRSELRDLLFDNFDRWRHQSSTRKSIKTAQTPLLINLPEVKRRKTGGDVIPLKVAVVEKVKDQAQL